MGTFGQRTITVNPSAQEHDERTSGFLVFGSDGERCPVSYLGWFPTQEDAAKFAKNSVDNGPKKATFLLPVTQAFLVK
jgi:hypothetical protein